MCVDTDPVNATFHGYKALNVKRLNIMKGDEIDPRNFDLLVEWLADIEDDAVIDNGAATFVPLANYLINNQVPDLLQGMGHELVIHTVVTRGQAMVDTLIGFTNLARQFPEPALFVVWLNPYWGIIEHEGRGFEKLKAYQDHKARVSAIVTIPTLKEERQWPIVEPAGTWIQHTGESERQAEALVNQVRTTETEQAALLETAEVKMQYTATLAAQVQAKHDQVDRIEDRLEGLIEGTEARLQQTQAQQPGFLARPGSRAQWQQQVQRQQVAIQRLHDRLENVREIRDGMGLHSPRIEELAMRKLRAQEPELAAEWDSLRDAQRRHQALLRKKEKEQRDQREVSRSLSLRRETI